MKKVSANILIVDDDPIVLTSAKLFLKQKYQHVHALSKIESIEEILSQTMFDIVLLDMNYTAGSSDGQEGIEILKRIIKVSPDSDVVPITAYGEIDLVVQSMKLGARDFITKPWSNERVYATLDNLIELRSATRQADHLKEVAQRSSSNSDILVGKSRIFLKTIQDIDKVAKTDASILLTGENGTGKSLFAERIHHLSNRNSHPMIRVDLGALPESLFESELFWSCKGRIHRCEEGPNRSIRVGQ